MATDDAKKTLIKGLNCEWLVGAINLVEESTGLSFGEDNTTVNEVSITFNENFSDEKLARLRYNTSTSSSASVKSLELRINTANFQEEADIDSSGTVGDGANYLDAVIAREMTRAVMAANIDYYSRYPAYITEGIAEIVRGGDYLRSDITYILNSGQNYLTTIYQDHTSTDFDAAAGYVMMRYLAKQGALYTNSTEQKVIKTFLEYLDEPQSSSNSNVQTTLNLAIRAATGGLFQTETDMTDMFLSLVTEEKISSDAQASQFVKNIAGIDLDNDDCGAITGSDANGGSSKAAVDIVPESSAVSSWTLPSTATSSYHSLAAVWPSAYISTTDTTSSGTLDGGGNGTVDTTSGGSNGGDDDDNENYNLPVGLTLSSGVLKVGTTYDSDLWLEGLNATYANSSVVTIDATATTDDMILAGNSKSNVIKGGSGENSLWGGYGGNDTMTGGSSSDQFWFTGNGCDVVTNFAQGTSNTSDVIVLSGDDFNSFSRTGTTVRINGSGSNYINLKTSSASSDAIVQFSFDGKNISEAKIASNSTASIKYDSEVDYFQMYGRGTMVVQDTSDVSVWLDGSAEQIYSGITNIRAATANGNNALAGNSAENSIFGGYGNSSLWGGSGEAADTLVGGMGAETFFYGKGEGNDSFVNVGNNDTIKLFNISLEEISDTNISSTEITVEFNDGYSLKIGNTGNTTNQFVLSDGSAWRYNRTTSSW